MKPSWVLSEEERGRRFKKNRERANELMDQSLPGPSSQSKESIFSEQLMETSQLSMVEQQQNLQPIVIKQENVKQTPETSSESNSVVQKIQNCAPLQTNPIASSSFQQVLLKTESGTGGESYIIAPVSSNQIQPAILVYTAAAIPQQPQQVQQVQQQASTAVIVPTASATATAVKLSSGQVMEMGFMGISIIHYQAFI